MNPKTPAAMARHGITIHDRWVWPCALTLLTLCAFALRWYYVSTAMVLDPVRGDATQYYAYAWNLVHHGIFSKDVPGSLTVVADSYRDPGYPAFLAAWMKALGTGTSWYAAVLLCQALLGALTVALVTQLGRYWLPMGWCLGAGVLMAVWPHSVTINSFLLTETLVGFLCALALFATAHAYHATSKTWAALAGLVFGAAALTNAVLLPFGLLLSGVLAWRKFAPAKVCIALALGALLLPSAWAIRNTQLPHVAERGHMSSSKDRAMETLVVGSWPGFHQAWADAIIRHDPAAQSTIDAVNEETRLLQSSPSDGVRAMLHRFSKHPLQYAAWYALEKPRLLWGWSIRVGQGDIYVYPTANSPFQTKPAFRILASLCHGLNLPLMLLAIVGVIFLWPARWRIDSATSSASRAAAIGVTCLLLFITLVYSTLQSEPRYSIPFRSFEMLLAVIGVYGLAIAWHRYRQVKTSNGTSAKITSDAGLT